MSLIHRLEPVWWMLFGAGGVLSATFYPALLLALCFAFPLGWFGDEVATFHRMRTLFANPVGQLLLIVGISTSLFHAAHHTRHLALDLGVHAEAAVSYLAYGGALVGTLVAIGLVGGL